MSSAVVTTSAAQSRLFIFDDESTPEVPLTGGAPSLSCCSLMGQAGGFDVRTNVSHFRQHLSKGSLPYSDLGLPHVTAASRLAVRPAPEMVFSGIAALDALTGGWPRGCITEICGPASSGRTSVLLAALAAATGRGECCALIDASDALEPHSAAAAGIDLDRLLWVRCGDSSQKINSPRRHGGTEENFFCQNQKLKNGFRNINPANEYCIEQVLRACDLLLESGGFGLIALDLADVAVESARRIPLTTWFRFRRAIEHTPTILLVIAPQSIAGSCSALALQFSSQFTVYSSQKNGTDGTIAEQKQSPSHTQFLTGLQISAQLLRSRVSGGPFSDFNSLSKTCPGRKPAGSVAIAFNSRTSWG